jgi:cytochrome c-type biogenesis protein CcmH
MLWSLIPAEAAAAAMPAGHRGLSHPAMVNAIARGASAGSTALGAMVHTAAALEHQAMGHLPLANVRPDAPDPSMVPLPEPREVQAGPELRRVLESILCQCGCNLTAYACEGSMPCDVSAQMRTDAERMFASGMDADGAIAAFAADYGEGVLAAPTKSGFNLMAWVLPFLVLGGGGLVVAFAVRGWRPKPDAATSAPKPQADPRYLAEIERELDQED